jgi:hypothetical protein
MMLIILYSRLAVRTNLQNDLAPTVINNLSLSITTDNLPDHCEPNINEIHVKMSRTTFSTRIIPIKEPKHFVDLLALNMVCDLQEAKMRNIATVNSL